MIRTILYSITTGALIGFALTAIYLAAIHR